MNKELKDAIAYLKDSKAEALVLLDFHGTGPMADSVLIATARAATHLKSLAEGLLSLLQGARAEQGEGWIVLDNGDAIIHLFLEDQREFYALEDLWDRAERIVL
jgi:ribosome-associated protein